MEERCQIGEAPYLSPDHHALVLTSQPWKSGHSPLLPIGYNLVLQPVSRSYPHRKINGSAGSLHRCKPYAQSAQTWRPTIQPGDDLA
jgi:hypothetical protein